MCVYSGDKLWILDGGATPYFTIDWADHVFPVAKGGSSTLENGVCASWNHNKEKRDNTDTPVFLFYGGKPTEHFYKLNCKLTCKMTHYLTRMGKLHHSDWYFNRALFRLLLGVNYLHNGIGVRSRDDIYYAKATLKAITKWRRIVLTESISTLEERELTPVKPSTGQKIMLEVRCANSVKEVRGIMKELLPVYASKEN